MAYMDIAPTVAANGRTLVLLHGKNFCAVTWGATAKRLAGEGYRVIVPDQIGFCKSSKPAGFQYSFAALATMTRDLIAQAGVTAPVTLDSFWQQAWNASVIWCRQSVNPPLTHQKRAAETLKARWYELDTSHYPMVTEPKALARLMMAE